jgi:hypothetical protein
VELPVWIVSADAKYADGSQLALSSSKTHGNHRELPTWRPPNIGFDILKPLVPSCRYSARDAWIEERRASGTSKNLEALLAQCFPAMVTSNTIAITKTKEKRRRKNLAIHRNLERRRYDGRRRSCLSQNGDLESINPIRAFVNVRNPVFVCTGESCRHCG